MKVVYIAVTLFAAVAVLYIARFEFGYTTFSNADLNKPKDAVFYVTVGFTGLVDSVPVVYPRETNEVYVVGDSHLYFDNTVREVNEAGRAPGCADGLITMRVNANVTMVTSIGIEPARPGVNVDQHPTVHYYTLKLNKLHDVKIKEKNCK